MSPDQRLIDIARSPVLANVSGDPDSHRLSVWLPHVAPFVGEHNKAEGDANGLLFLHTINVPEPLRGKRIASRMMSAMVGLAAAEGYTTLYSEVDSPYTIRMFESLGLGDKLVFYDKIPGTDEEAVVHMPPRQAIMSLEGKDHGSSMADRGLYLDFSVYIGGVALDNLEQSVRVNQLPK